MWIDYTDIADMLRCAACSVDTTVFHMRLMAQEYSTCIHLLNRVEEES